MRRYFQITMILFFFFFLGTGTSWAGPMRIAIPSFKNNTGDQKLDFLREELPDRLIEKLRLIKDIEIVERETLKEILKDMMLQQPIKDKESLASRIGKLLCVQGLLYGDIIQTELGETPIYKLNVQMVDTESGRAVNEWFSSGELSDFPAMVTILSGKISDYVKQKVAIRNLTELIHLNPPFKIELWTDKKRYRIGEKLIIYFRSEKDCYLTLIDMTTSGKFYILFPNLYTADNYIKAGKVYSIPGLHHTFSITVGEPRGFERLKAIATLENVNLINTRVWEGKQIFVNLLEPTKAIRGIKVIITTTPKLTWSDAYHEVIIE